MKKGKTEITKDRLRENLYPSKNFCRKALDNAIVDYAEIEIDPKGIKKLENNLERCGNQGGFSEEEWKDINNPDSDNYEHIVAYVHFDAGTDQFNKLFISVITINSEDELEVDKILNDAEKQNIIDAALESLHKWRGTDKMIDQEGYDILQMIKEKETGKTQKNVWLDTKHQLKAMKEAVENGNIIMSELVPAFVYTFMRDSEAMRSAFISAVPYDVKSAIKDELDKDDIRYAVKTYTTSHHLPYTYELADHVANRWIEENFTRDCPDYWTYIGALIEEESEKLGLSKK